MRYIKSAAIKMSSDLFTGKNHGACLRKLKSASRQGFLVVGPTYASSRFVTREEALEIAIAAGQRIDKHKPMGILLSEDLREDPLFTG